MSEQSKAKTTCGQCIMLSECAYEFGANPDDPVCTGFRQPLRIPLANQKGQDHE